MFFFTMVFKNLARRPVRSVLTISAIGVALAATIALVGVSNGFKTSYLQIYDRMGVDFVVVKTRTFNKLSSLLNESLAPKMALVPGVKEVVPGLIDVISFEDKGLLGVLLQGYVPETMVLSNLKILNGRSLKKTDEHVVIVGGGVASSLKVKAGDRLTVLDGAEPFEVVGVFESNNVFENGMIIMPLSEMQKLTDHVGQVTGFSVVTDAHSDPARLETIRQAIEKVDPDIACAAARQHVETLAQVDRARSMAWLTSAIALFIGAVGVMNTMVMATYERSREIGLLRAVGWRRWRVLSLLLAESVCLSILGAVVGTIAAIVLVTFLTSLPSVRGFISGSIGYDVIARGFVLALLVGVLGGLIPAYRVATLLPTRALRIE